MVTGDPCMACGQQDTVKLHEWNIDYRQCVEDHNRFAIEVRRCINLDARSSANENGGYPPVKKPLDTDDCTEAHTKSRCWPQVLVSRGAGLDRNEECKQLEDVLIVAADMIWIASTMLMGGALVRVCKRARCRI